MEILQNIKWVQKASEAKMAISLNLYKDGCSSEIRAVVNPMSVVDRGGGGRGGGSDVHSQNHTNILLFLTILLYKFYHCKFILYTLNYTLQADLVSHIFYNVLSRLFKIPDGCS